MSVVELHRLWRESATVEDALAAYGRLAPSWEDAGAWVILSTPRRCVFAMLEAGGDLTQHRNAKVEMEDVFEIRAFSAAGELRWVRRPGGSGRAHLISERDLSSLGLGWRSCTQIAEGRLDNAYLLWGTREEAGAPSPWVRHYDSRVGDLWVPYRVREGVEPMAWIHSKEYLVEEREHGNLAVGDELLVAVSDVPPRMERT